MKMIGALLVTLWLCMITLSSSSERCDDWGVDTMKQIQIYDGEPAKIKCPLFETFLKYNYSTAHSAGLTLIWYRIGQDRDLEEPINFRLPDNRISKEKDTLWFWPALLNDTGNYTCMLRNTTYCSKVAFPLEVVAKDQYSCVSHSIKPTEEMFYLEHANEKIICPDIDGFYPASVTPTVKWYRNCKLVDGFYERYPQGPKLVIGIVRSVYEGNYTCIVTFKDHRRTYNLTRTIKMKVVGSPNKALPPQFTSPNEKVVYELDPGDDLVLSCEVFFTFLKDSRTEVWWTIDGKNTDDIMDPKIKVTQSETIESFEDKTIIRTLMVAKATPEDLKRNYTCYARNARGEDHSQAIVRMKVVPPKYTVELACGLGATILLVVVLIVVYHVYWLEMVLFYRAHFGTDEIILDGKEYDVYVSYARNAEEEEFVLLTLRGVLENEFGYKLCIFDRDSLPGGNTTEAVFDFIQRSRRMIVVLSPDYLTEKSISLLEFKLGIMCQNAIATKLIVVEYRPLQCTHPSILQLKESVSFVTWKGEKSKRSGSQFWKALRLALPLRSLNAGSGWNESCSSQSDISLDPIQRRRSRLKGQPEVQGAAAGAVAPRRPAAAPRSKAKHRAKHFLACQCCVTYCNGDSRLQRKHRAVTESRWETHLCKPGSGRPEAQGIQDRSRPEPPPAQVPTLALCHYSDLSNNNDFYVL
uniref:Interleukin-1 receptor accessory protein n=1 Tax=Dromaius novaehollandiae TaxID=8790 RepID=A0A8C4JJ44_DRONO|nr:interleukin-1 receptor accessory protein isoform X1 [Dromaius novaehollandiae]XP_025949280.1 interleukin-1 receptor accessory protein isoform X1 [Dromaius novaehollandiae]XP_025949281.1 interleukin-1 receptor accessory protein isoform X1 [Dromaius novaehollandiae]XP_025949282.1 interleukin-1 receptor accessory protein isoform X1 [Dromaius novaehollandiae]